MSKKPRIQGIRMNSNGNSNPTVPPDLVWSDDEPLVLNACSQHTDHRNGCKGDCETFTPNEMQVALMNEGRAWARIPMSYQGVPTCFPDGAFDGIKVDSFDLKMRIHTMQVLMLKAGICTEEEIEQTFCELKLEALQQIREQYQSVVKLHQAQQMMAIPDKRILGPDGQAL